MIQKLFGIYYGDKVKGRLFLEIGKEQLACWILDNASGELCCFELFSLKKEEPFANAFEEIRKQSAILPHADPSEKITVIWENAQAQYIPESFEPGIQPSFLQYALMPARGKKELHYRMTNGCSLYYMVDSDIYSLISKQYPHIEFLHKYGAIAKVLNSSAPHPELEIYIIYYQTHCILTAVDKGRQLFIKRIDYSSPLDTVYYILDTIQLYGRRPEEARVIISGLIDENSPLYTNLLKFIPHVQIDEVTTNMYDANKFQEYPKHYFIPFFKYAL